MGVYIYSLRAKTIQLTTDGAAHLGPQFALPSKITAHLYSYAYRYTSLWRGDYGYKSYKLTESNTERHALNVWANAADNRASPGAVESIPFVVVGDLKEKDGLDGHSVYADVTKPIHYDTDKFPGTLVGFVRKVGTRYQLTDHTEWSKGTKALRGDAWVPVRTRTVMIDGKPVYQSEDEAPDRDYASACERNSGEF